MTPEQKKVLKSIIAINKKKGSCSILDIKKANKFHESTARYYVKRLVEQGYVTYYPQQMSRVVLNKVDLT